MSSHTDDSIGKLIVVTDVRLFSEGVARILADSAPSIAIHTARPDDKLPATTAKICPDVALIDAFAIKAGRAAQSLRAAAPAVRIVAFAIAEDEEDVVACARAGATGFVSRDAPPEDLVSAITSAFRGEPWCSSSLTAVMCACLAVAGEQSPQSPNSWLTEREKEVLMLVDEGLSNKQIAKRLCIETSTVKNHVHRILEKLRVRHRWQAAAVLRGLVPATATTST